MLTSTTDWTGRKVGDTILGFPAVDPKTGAFVWDGAVPAGTISSDGDIVLDPDPTPIGQPAVPVPVGELWLIDGLTDVVPKALTKAEVAKGDRLDTIPKRPTDKDPAELPGDVLPEELPVEPVKPAKK